MIEKKTQLIMLEGKPVSSCCQADVERRVDYTDTHIFVVSHADADENGKITAAWYDFLKTYDGLDGQNPEIACRQCGRLIDEGDIEWQEA